MYIDAFFLKNNIELQNLKIKRIKLRELRDDEVLIKNEYIGVNDLDYQQVLGVHSSRYPIIIGCESAGTIVKISNVNTDFKEGDRVACCTIPFGAYATYRIVPLQSLIPIPKDIDASTLVSFLYKAMYANSLLFNTYSLKKNIPIIICNAEGSIGSFMCQYSKNIQCNVIAITNSNNANNEIFLKANNFASLIIDHNDDDFVQKIISYTKGIGVGAVFDCNPDPKNIKHYLDCLMVWGMYVLCDNLQSPLKSIDTRLLYSKSLYFTRPSFFVQKKSRIFFITAALEVIDNYRSNKIFTKIHKEYNLVDAAKALMELKQGSNLGSSFVLKV